MNSHQELFGGNIPQDGKGSVINKKRLGQKS